LDKISTMKLEIRPPKNPNEYKDIVTLEQTIWQIESGVDAETMMAIGKNGGVELSWANLGK
jgi:hypothetical protein